MADDRAARKGGGVMTAKSDLHGPTVRELQIIEFDELGYTPAEIAKTMGVSKYYVEQRLHGLSMADTQRDLAFFAMARRGTEQLGRALIAAGGHR